MTVSVSGRRTPHSCLSTRRAGGRILPLAAAALMAVALPVLPALAQAQSSPGSVLVTATRTPVRVNEALSDVTVLERADIERAAGRTLAELLGQQPGIQFWSNGGAGKASSVSVRGLESRHTLLLIDGVRYGSATLGTPSWENIPLDSIERIEIVRGPLSGLYGSDAVAGVVQIFTRGGTAGTRGNASATLGSNSTQALGAGLRFGDGTVDGSLQLNRLRTDGISSANANAPFGAFNPDRDGFRQTSGSGRLGWQLAPGWKAEAHAMGADGEVQIDDGVNANARAGLRTEAMGLQLTGAVAKGWTTVLRANRSYDAYQTLATASAFTPLGTTSTRQQLLAWENRVDTAVGTAVLVAERTEQTVKRPGTPFAVSERSITGLAAGLNGRSGAQSWQGNVRHDRNSQFGSQTTGSAGYGLDFAPGWRATANLGTSFVQPSFNQLYFPGFGNPNLQPETGRHGELSLRWADPVQQVKLTAFDHRIRGYISSGPLPTNIPRIRSDGFSLSWEAAWDRWTVLASAEQADPRNDTTGSANFGKQLARRAKESLKLAGTARLGDWRLGGALTAFGPRFEDAANTRRVGGFGVVDLNADWLLSRDWTLGLKLNNAGGKRYETTYGYNQPGREAFLTLRYSGR